MDAVEVFQIAIASWGGFLVALYGFRQVTTWLFYSWSQLNPEHGKRSIVAFLVAFFLSPGLWMLIALALVSSYFAFSWWAPWAIGGAAAGALYILGVAVFFMRKSKKGANERAA